MNGACQPITCGTTSCQLPPAASCTSANTLRRFAKLGRCSNGSCDYQPIEVDCSQGCLNGACLPGSKALEQLPLAGVFKPQELAVDAQGGLYVVGTNAAHDVVVWVRDDFGWSEEVVDVGMGATTQAALGLDGQGVAVVAYYDSVNRDLRLASRKQGQWVKELVAQSGTVGLGISLSFDAQNNPVLAFFRTSPDELQVARRFNFQWAIETVTDEVNLKQNMRTAIQFNQNGELEVVGGSATHLTPIIYRVFRNSQWEASGPASNAALTVRPLGARPDGTSMVAYLDGDNPGPNVTVAVRQPDGTFFYEWVPAIVSSSSPHSALASLSGPPRPVVVPGMYRRHEGGYWAKEPVGPTSPGQTGLAHHDLRVGPDQRIRLLVSNSGIVGVLTQPACTPQCTGRVCGDDGCGGSCGSCTGNQFCGVDGLCSAWSYQHLPQSNPTSQWVRLGGTSSSVHAFGGGAGWQKTSAGWRFAGPKALQHKGVFAFQGPNAYWAQSTSTQFSVSQWNQNGWQTWAAGPFAPGTGSSVPPVVAVGPHGPQLVTLQESYCQAHHKAFLNNAWVSSSIYPTDCKNLPLLTVDATGVSHVFINETPNFYNSKLWHFTNASGSWAKEEVAAGYGAYKLLGATTDGAGTPQVVYGRSAWYLSKKTPSGWTQESFHTFNGQEPLAVAFSPQGNALAIFSNPAQKTVSLGERLGANHWQLEPLQTYGAATDADVFVDEVGGIHVLIRDTYVTLYAYRP